MKIMKNILLLAALSGGLTMTSCSGSFLDEDMNPNYLSPATFWKSEGDIMKGLTAAYGGMQPNASWAVPYERYIVIDNYRSDECIYRADVSSWMAMANLLTNLQVLFQEKNGLTCIKVSTTPISVLTIFLMYRNQVVK